MTSDSLPGLANNTASAEGGIAISTNASLQPVALFGQPAGSPLFQQVGFAH
jgi:hypothetical protein